MALKTPEEYEASLRKLNFKIYLMGEQVKNPVDHPMIRPSMNSVKMTYALAQEPEHEDLMTATSHLTGEKINRFCHLHQSTAGPGQESEDAATCWDNKPVPASSAVWAWTPSTPLTASPLKWIRNWAPPITTALISFCA